MDNKQQYKSTQVLSSSVLSTKSLLKQPPIFAYLKDMRNDVTQNVLLY